MEEEQNGLCAICGRDRPLVVDHDHSTEQVRRLLCRTCNGLLGFAEDDINILQRAIEYLEFYN